MNQRQLRTAALLEALDCTMARIRRYKRPPPRTVAAVQQLGELIEREKKFLTQDEAEAIRVRLTGYINELKGR